MNIRAAITIWISRNPFQKYQVLPDVLDELPAGGAGKFDPARVNQVPLFFLRVAVQSALLGLLEMEQFTCAECDSGKRSEQLVNLHIRYS